MAHADAPGGLELDARRLTVPRDSGWGRLPWIAGGIGAAATLGSLALAGAAPERFYYAWLTAFLFFLSIALGGLFFVLVHYATKAGWGVAVRRLAENAMATLPLFALLFVPVALGVHRLYHWSHPDAVAHDALLRGKAPFLNTGFFLVRAALYFTVWIVTAWLYSRGSRGQDRTGDERVSRRLTNASGPAIVVFAVSVSFAAIDWIMSLTPHWYSTIFGVYFFAGCLVGIFAFLVLVAVAMRRAGYLRNVVTIEHFHDLGKLLFAFTVFWAYIAFSQYFLIWYGNIPEETVWYLARGAGAWKTLSILLGVGHFLVPFFFLMPQTIKRRTGLLAAGAVWMLAMHLLDVYWLVMPAILPDGPRVGLVDVAAFLAVGGWFVGAWAWLATRSPLVPIRDPRLGESLSFENA